jgi:hypothetical protein
MLAPVVGVAGEHGQDRDLRNKNQVGRLLPLDLSICGAALLFPDPPWRRGGEGE